MSTTAIVVDDEKDIVDVFSEYLAINGIKIIGKAHNGKEAVSLYRKLSPDVVLSDVMMPKYDGFYELEKIRQYDPDAKIIFVTASLSHGTEKRMREHMPSAIVNKPFDMDYLLDTIQRVKNGESEIYPIRNS